MSHPDAAGREQPAALGHGTSGLPPTPRLSVRGIAKRFESTVALRGIDLDVFDGEIVGLIGENGAGKSTLAKIIAGIQQPDAGSIRVEGHHRVIRSVRMAQQLGIAVVHQELNLVPHLDVASNIVLGREPVLVKGIRLEDRRQLEAGALRALEMVGMQVALSALVMDLSVAQQQRVEIAKALSLDARLLILDEPTSSLPVADADALLALLDGLRSRGISVIYISHRLDEVCRISDRVVVFRDGEKVAETPACGVTQDALVTAMVGRELSTLFPPCGSGPGSPALQVRGLRAPGLSAEASFEARAGEVLGIAGLVGSGRSELLRAVFGASRRTAGRVIIGGTHVPPGRPLASMDAGMGLVPEDRKSEGLVLPMSLRDNLCLCVLRRLARAGLRRPRDEDRTADGFMRRLAIQASSREQAVVGLSGGNQQKVLLAKWLAIAPRVLLLDEPTRGIDVGAKHEVYRLIAGIAGEGVAVVVVSSEMEEIIGLCHRALVMNAGRIAGELSREELTEERIMRLAAQTGSPGAAGRAGPRRSPPHAGPQGDGDA